MSDSGDLYDAPSRDSDYEYDDPDEMHRVRRLRQIHDARDRFEKVRLKAEERFDRGQLSAERIRKYTAQLALDYVRQLEPILDRADTDLLDRTVTVTDATETVGPREVSIADLLDANGTLTITYEYEQRNPDTQAMERRTDTAKLAMDRAAATRLVRLCDDFLEDVMPSGLSNTDADEWEI